LWNTHTPELINHKYADPHILKVMFYYLFLMNRGVATTLIYIISTMEHSLVKDNPSTKSIPSYLYSPILSFTYHSQL